MISESRKLFVIEKVLKLNNEALLAKIEALLKRTYTKPKRQVRLSEKYGGSLKLTGKQYADMQQQLKDMRNEWGCNKIHLSPQLQNMQGQHILTKK